MIDQKDALAKLLEEDRQRCDQKTFKIIPYPHKSLLDLFYLNPTTDSILNASLSKSVLKQYLVTDSSNIEDLFPKKPSVFDKKINPSYTPFSQLPFLHFMIKLCLTLVIFSIILDLGSKALKQDLRPKSYSL